MVLARWICGVAVVVCVGCGGTGGAGDAPVMQDPDGEVAPSDSDDGGPDADAPGADVAGADGGADSSILADVPDAVGSPDASSPGAPAAWELQRGWLLSFQVVSAKDNEGNEAALQAAMVLKHGIHLWLSDNGDVWSQFADAPGASGPHHPTVAGDGIMTVEVEGHQSGAYCNWKNSDMTLVLSALDMDGDGTVDALTGTATGEVGSEDGDVAAMSATFQATVTGVPDIQAPLVHLVAEGYWPERRILLRASEPVCDAHLSEATVLRVDGVELAFLYVNGSKLDGPAGCGSSWEVVPAAPFTPGGMIELSVGPVPDLAGNLSVSKALKVEVPPTPEPLDVPWDFSAGDPFVPKSGKVKIVESHGGTEAQSGGAMAMAGFPLDESGRLTVGVAVPGGPAHAVVTLALAGRVFDIESAVPRLWVRTAGGVREAPVLVGPAIVSAGGESADGGASDDYGVTEFVEASIDLQGLTPGVAFLDVGFVVPQWDWCFLGPGWDAVTLLVDRIDVVTGKLP